MYVGASEQSVSLKSDLQTSGSQAEFGQLTNIAFPPLVCIAHGSEDGGAGVEGGAGQRRLKKGKMYG